MSLTPSRKPSTGQRRRSVGTSGGGGRYAHSEASSTNTNTYPGRVRALEGGPTARTYPSTPRRQAKHTVCSDNHGIRPPTPEQYLTPLQQKEVCIRHLRARLRENVERLQHRDCEIDELRSQLYRMQEDWIEEECQRVEAQLALKEARKEIQQLQEVVESVRSNLAAEPHPLPHKTYSGLKEPRPPAGRSRSCGCSPAGTLSRSATYSRLSSEALHLERGAAASANANANAAASPGRAPRPAGPGHLLLEAALLSEQPPPPPPPGPPGRGGPPGVARSSTYERLCAGGTLLPVSHSCLSLAGGCRCGGHAYLPHHHLFLHLPQEGVPAAAETPVAPASEPIPAPAAAAPDRRPEVRSQACSPTMTWLCEESGGEELSIISLEAATPSEPLPSRPTLPPDVSFLPPDKAEDPRAPAEPRTRQPPPAAPLPVGQEATVLEMEEGEGGDGGDGPPPQLCHWSRYFLVDLLALAVPVVPTMAWLCRGAPRDVMPVYHIGSLLRGCCAVALHSLRRQGAGRGRRPHSMNGTTPI